MLEQIIYPLLGGILIGVSSSTMLGGLGRITGISGIMGGSLTIPKKEELWRFAFLGGLILGGFIFMKIKPEFFNYSFEFSALQYVSAGLLVGYGTRLGSGCTSGHGVCGMARLAKRSIIATITFILFGMITVAVKGMLV
ncbi:MAG: putative membrane protein YedE/YeeE [Bacteriovoracaceae bacterium]|jgi:uncharacterized membrane protein YedE/YeeE